jgi:hypothetical protein
MHFRRTDSLVWRTVSGCPVCRGLQNLEAKIKYTFKDKTLLMEALSHPTDHTNRLTVSYHRLAFLGDAVLGNSFFADSLLDPSFIID